jgi:hypothetical protein
MSLLLVEVVPQGIIFGADRNVTFTKKQVVKGKHTTIEIHGQSQRPKVLRWPQRKALVGYVGVAEIGGDPTDEWLYDFIGDNLNFSNFEALSESLRSQVEEQLRIDEGNNERQPLIIHLGGFEKRDDVPVPVIWYIRNTYGLGPLGYKEVRKEFHHSEEFWRVFSNVSYHEIRSHISEKAAKYNPFWFHQGFDLGTFNVIEEFLKAAFKWLCEHNPSHSLPQKLSDWERQVRMSILTYGAYFQAFKGPSQQFVGGGVDVVSIEWPQQAS